MHNLQNDTPLIINNTNCSIKSMDSNSPSVVTSSSKNRRLKSCTLFSECCAPSVGGRDSTGSVVRTHHICTAMWFGSCSHACTVLSTSLTDFFVLEFVKHVVSRVGKYIWRRIDIIQNPGDSRPPTVARDEVIPDYLGHPSIVMTNP